MAYTYSIDQLTAFFNEYASPESIHYKPGEKSWINFGRTPSIEPGMPITAEDCRYEVEAPLDYEDFLRKIYAQILATEDHILAYYAPVSTFYDKHKIIEEENGPILEFVKRLNP